MISVSAGSRSPSLRARGSSTVRLCPARTRRSRSARRPSSDARASRRSASARAALRAEVCRAITAQSAASNATSQKAIQWRPLNLTGGLLEHAELRRAGPRVGRDLGGLGRDRLLREHAPGRAAPARAHRLAGRTDTLPAPLPERVLHNAIFSGMVRNDAESAARDERVAHYRQGSDQRAELVIDGDAEGLKQAREIRRAGPRPQDGANRVHEIVAHGERGRQPAPDDFLCKRPPPSLVGVFGKHARQSLDGPGVQNVARRYSGSWLPAPSSWHSHVERRAGPEGEATFRRVDLVRAHAEVEQDAVGLELSNGGKGGRGGKRSFEILDAVGAETVAGGGDGVGIAVETQDPSPGLPQQGRVTAAAERSVDGAGGPPCPLAHGRGEDRDVVLSRG